MKRRLLSLALAALLLLTLVPASALADGDMRFSDALVDYIKKGEGYRAMPYSDGAGNWLIGYGCVCDPSQYPNGVTEPEAEALLRQKLDQFADAVNVFLRRYGVSLRQGQFDALCALSYNLGSGWLRAGNRLPDMLIDGLDKYSRQEIATAYAVWCHVGSEPSELLLSRRSMELNMFFSDDYSMSDREWRWLILDANGGLNAYSDVAMYPAGEPYGVLPTATRTGWTFAGWQTERGWILRESDIVDKPLHLTALWTEGESEPGPGVLPEPGPEPELDPVEEAPFPDVATDAWFAPYVAHLVRGGVVNGYDDGLFHPGCDVTWGQALKLVLLSAGFPVQRPEDEDTHWAECYLRFAEERNYPRPEPEQLDDPIRRDELAALCAAALELPPVEAESPYLDCDDPAVLALYAAGIMHGSLSEDGRVFLGADALRRSEVCAVMVRMMFYVPEHFVFVSGCRAAINFDLPMSEYDPESFSVDARGRLVCSDEALQTRCGVDVSAHQGEIDWEAVAADGVEFAFIRAGYRGYGSKGSLNEDDYFRDNLAGALAAGLDVGVYFFSQAMSVEEALEEAAYVLELIGDAELSLPVVFDWEKLTWDGSRTADPDWETVTACAVAYCEAIRDAGFSPMVYYNKHMAYLEYDLTKLQDFPTWLAWYHTYPDYIYTYDIWQYGTGRVAGIDGPVDLNIQLK